MLEVLYDTTNNRVKGWCANSNQFGNFQPKPEQAIVVLDVPIPAKADWYEVNLVNNVIISNPEYKPKPRLCTHWAIVDSFNADTDRPLRVRRTWRGYEYEVDCYVTQTIKDQYLVGKITVGDLVLVEFLEDKADRAIVFAKVFKSW